MIRVAPVECEPASMTAHSLLALDDRAARRSAVERFDRDMPARSALDLLCDVVKS